MNFIHFFYAAGLLSVASIAGLWSWNTLAELSILPVAGLRHVFAVIALLLIVKALIMPRKRTARWSARCKHGHSAS